MSSHDPQHDIRTTRAAIEARMVADSTVTGKVSEQPQEHAENGEFLQGSPPSYAPL